MSINLKKYQVAEGMTRVSDAENKFREVIIKGFKKFDSKTIKDCGISKIEECCHNHDFVRATIDKGFEIENAISTVHRQDDPEVKGGINFEIIIDPIGMTGQGETEFSLDDFQFPENPKPAEYNGEKIIVIMDTGLDIRVFQENEFKLFDSTEYNKVLIPEKGNPEKNENIQTPNYGWNFVDDDANLSDFNLHGTFVTKNLLDNLRVAKFSDFQILPLKVFNEDGWGSFWTIVRAFDYLQEMKQKNPSLDIAIINASFGSLQDDYESFDFTENAMLKTYIDYFRDTTIVVTPAGNENNDNDNVKKPHFPSNYASSLTYPITACSNLFAVAGHSRSGYVELSEGRQNNSDFGSNYGRKSVNIAAPWKYRLKLKNDTVLINLEGTSFSSSYLSAKLLDYIMKSKTSNKGSELLREFLSPNTNELIASDELLPLRNGVFLT